MASGRMIQRKISSNKELPKLIALLDGRMGHPHGAMAALLYTWSIAHLDCEGRMHGDPFVVKGSVVPRISFITPELVETYLVAMAEVGLVVYYEAEDDRWLFFPAFEGSQPHLRKDREADSKIPSHHNAMRIISGSTPEQLRRDSGPTPAEEKRSSREDQDQEKGTHTDARARVGEVAAAWRTARLPGLPSAVQFSDLAQALEGFTMTPEQACAGWRTVVDAWTKKNIVCPVTPEKMRANLSTIQRLVDGELKPEQLSFRSTNGVNGRPEQPEQRLPPSVEERLAEYAEADE
jgi:hypothetical protein